MPTPTIRFALLMTLLVLVPLAGTGCASLFGRGQSLVDLSRDEARRLSSELSSYYSSTEIAIDRATDEVRRETSSRAVRQAAADFESTYIKRLENVLANQNPVVAYSDAWLLAERYRRTVTDGQNAEIFEDQQEIIVEFSENQVQQLRAMANDYDFTPEGLEQLRQRIDEAATNHPLGPNFSDTENFSFKLARDGLGVLGTALRVPLVPLEQVQNVANTADAINRANDTAERFADIAEEYPYVVRAETEQLLYNLHESDTITTAMLNMTTFANSAERLSYTPENIPRIVRDTTRATIEEMLEAEQELRDLLEELQTLMARVERTSMNVETISANAERSIESGTAGAERVLGEAQPTLREATRLSESIDRTIATAGETVTIVQGFLESMKPEEPAPDPPEPGKPFDILEYRDTLVAAESTVAELRRVLETVNGTLQSPAIEALQADAVETLAASTAQISQLVDHVIWRLAQLVILIGVVLAGLAMLKYRLQRRGKVLPANQTGESEQQ